METELSDATKPRNAKSHQNHEGARNRVSSRVSGKITALLTL